MWNVSYDDILSLSLPIEVDTIEYADDLAEVTWIRGEQELNLRPNRALAVSVDRWRAEFKNSCRKDPGNLFVKRQKNSRRRPDQVLSFRPHVAKTTNSVAHSIISIISNVEQRALQK